MIGMVPPDLSQPQTAFPSYYQPEVSESVRPLMRAPRCRAHSGTVAQQYREHRLHPSLLPPHACTRGRSISVGGSISLLAEQSYPKAAHLRVRACANASAYGAALRRHARRCALPRRLTSRSLTASAGAAAAGGAPAQRVRPEPGAAAAGAQVPPGGAGHCPGACVRRLQPQLSACCRIAMRQVLTRPRGPQTPPPVRQLCALLHVSRTASPQSRQEVCRFPP